MRASQARPQTNIQPGGRAEGESETQDRFSAKEGGRSDAARPKTSMQPLEGSLAGETETDKQFKPKFGRRSKGSKKSGNLKSDGLEFGDGTEHGKYSEHEWREREKEARRADTLAVLDGTLEGESEAKDKYNPKHGRRASRAKARSHLGTLEGKLEGETEYGDRFTESAREGDARAKFKLDQTLITPYGNFARYSFEVEANIATTLRDVLQEHFFPQLCCANGGSNIYQKSVTSVISNISIYFPALPCDWGTAGDIGRPKLFSISLWQLI